MKRVQNTQLKIKIKKMIKREILDLVNIFIIFEIGAAGENFEVSIYKNTISRQVLPNTQLNDKNKNDKNKMIKMAQKLLS